MAIYPLPGKVYLRILDSTSEVSGIIIPQKKSKDQEVYLQAEIVSVGEGVYDVRPGDKVIIPHYAGNFVGSEISLSTDETFRIVTESEISAVVSPKAAANE